MALGADDFTILMPEVTAGEGVEITLLRPDSHYTFRLHYQLSQAQGDVAQADLEVLAQKEGYVRCLWTVPLSLQQQLPDDCSGEGTLTVYVDYTGDVPEMNRQSVCTLSKTFTLYVPEETRPTAALSVTPLNDNPVLETWGLCVRGKSRLHYVITAQAAGGASVSGGSFACLDGRGTGLSGDTDILRTAGTALPTAQVSDSRGRTASCAAEAFTVWDYHPPALDNVSVCRCGETGAASWDGAYLSVCATASCTSLGGRNSAALRIRYRPVGGTWGDYAALQSGVTAVVGGTLDGTAAYEAEVSAVDTVGGVCTVTRTLSTAAVTLHLRPGGQGAAFGKLAAQAGFGCAWDAAFDGAVAVAGTLSVGGHALWELSYPVGALYLSAAETEPSRLFGGTWQRLEDCLLLAGGAACAPGSTGSVGSGTAVSYRAVYVWQRTA